MKSRLILVFIITSLTFQSKETFSQVYDVQIILDKIVCRKAVELWPDTQDDLFGKIDIVSYVVNDKNGVRKKNGYFKGTPDFYNSITNNSISGNVLWNKSKEYPLQMATGQTMTSGASFTVSNLNLSQILSFEFLVGGVVSDAEIRDVRYQPCTSCGFNFAEGTSLFGAALNYRLLKMSNYKSQIEAIVSGTSKNLKMGDDNYFQLDFYETDQNSAHVQFFFKIKITNRSL